MAPLYFLFLAITSCLAAVSPLKPPPKRLAFALERRNMTIDKRSPTNVPMTFYSEGGEYYATIYLGTPAQAFTVNVDTGSWLTWVPLTGCTNCNSAHYYSPSASSSSVDKQKVFTVTYASGLTSTGEYYSDHASIGGFSLSNFAFGAASTLSRAGVSGDPIDGIMGLAIPSSGDTNVPFPWAAKAAGLITNVIFGVKYTTTGGELSIGALDTALYTGSIDWHTILSTSNHWELISNIIVNGVTAVAGVTAMLDTGTTLIYGPTADVAAFHAQIPGATFDGTTKLWSIPCTAGSNTVGFQFGGVTHPANWAYLRARGTGTMCLSEIRPSTSGSTIWTFGQRFLINQYNIFDGDNRRVGFATLV